MANNLTSTVRAALQGPNVDASSIVWTYELVELAEDLTERIADEWGATTDKAANWHPTKKADRAGFEMPQLEFRCANDDHALTPGAPGNVWGSTLPSNVTLRVKATIETSGGTETIVQRDFRVVDVDSDGDFARVLCSHFLADKLDAAWGDDHAWVFEDIDLDGNSTITVAEED